MQASTDIIYYSSAVAMIYSWRNSDGWRN